MPINTTAGLIASQSPLEYQGQGRPTERLFREVLERLGGIERRLDELEKWRNLWKLDGIESAEIIEVDERGGEYV